MLKKTRIDWHYYHIGVCVCVSLSTSLSLAHSLQSLSHSIRSLHCVLFLVLLQLYKILYCFCVIVSFFLFSNFFLSLFHSNGERFVAIHRGNCEKNTNSHTHVRRATKQIKSIYKKNEVYNKYTRTHCRSEPGQCNILHRKIIALFVVSAHSIHICISMIIYM